MNRKLIVNVSVVEVAYYTLKYCFALLFYYYYDWSPYFYNSIVIHFFNVEWYSIHILQVFALLTQSLFHLLEIFRSKNSILWSYNSKPLISRAY